MRIKAIGMFSGGLDSMLAVQLMKEQDVEVDVLHYDIGVEPLSLMRRVKKKASEVPESDIEQQLGINIQHLDVSEDFLQVLLNPKHGYGSGMNPCIDCKTFIFQKAREYMEAHDAHFVFTGEVVGQRPMSQQRQTMLQIEKASGLSGYLLRPLSAKLLEPTIPEQRGWVDREKLLNISGRSRNVQMKLARKYNFRYRQPAGGCLLTDPGYSKRLREFLEFTPKEKVAADELTLLKLGRHFRLPGDLKVIVGRHELDNNLLARYIHGRWSAEARDYQGPLVLIEGEPTTEQCEQIAQLLVSYTKGKQAEQATVNFLFGDECRSITIVPNPTLNFTQWRVT